MGSRVWKTVTAGLTAGGLVGAGAFSAFLPPEAPTLHHKGTPTTHALLDQCPLLHTPVSPPWWLRSAHAQLLLHDRKKRWEAATIQLKRQHLHHPDGGTTALDWVVDDQSSGALHNTVVADHVATESHDGVAEWIAKGGRGGGAESVDSRMVQNREKTPTRTTNACELMPDARHSGVEVIPHLKPNPCELDDDKMPVVILLHGARLDWILLKFDQEI
jgi:predicted alpha/beta-fold hydrolase